MGLLLSLNELVIIRMGWTWLASTIYWPILEIEMQNKLTLKLRNIFLSPKNYNIKLNCSV